MMKETKMLELNLLLNEMKKLRVLLNDVIDRLQTVSLKQEDLKKCVRVVNKVSKSFFSFQAIIGGRTTKVSRSTLSGFEDEGCPQLSAPTKRAHVTRNATNIMNITRKVSRPRTSAGNCEDTAKVKGTETIRVGDDKATNGNTKDGTEEDAEVNNTGVCAETESNRTTLKAAENAQINKDDTKCIESEEDLIASDTKTRNERRNVTCKLCLKQYINVNTLKVHMRKHTGERPFACSICGMKFKVNGCLKDHMNTHTGARPYLCNICGKGFAGRGGLFLHTKTHTKNHPHKCGTCERTFPTKQRLNDHTMSHSDDRPYKCSFENCTAVFKTEVTMKKHMKGSHGPKQYFCHICAKQFTRAASLRLHTQRHQGSYKFSCQLCNKTFRDGSRLRQHEQVHKNIRPFACKECHKAFHNRRTLQDHIRIHTGDKPFRCSICGRTFTQSATLNKHIRCHNKGTRDQGLDVRQKQMTSADQSQTKREREKDVTDAATDVKATFDSTASTKMQAQQLTALRNTPAAGITSYQQISPDLQKMQSAGTKRLVDSKEMTVLAESGLGHYTGSGNTNPSIDMQCITPTTAVRTNLTTALTPGLVVSNCNQSNSVVPPISSMIGNFSIPNIPVSLVSQVTAAQVKFTSCPPSVTETLTSIANSQVLGIQQMAAQIIQEAKGKQPRDTVQLNIPTINSLTNPEKDADFEKLCNSEEDS